MAEEMWKLVGSSPVNIMPDPERMRHAVRLPKVPDDAVRVYEFPYTPNPTLIVLESDGNVIICIRFPKPITSTIHMVPGMTADEWLVRLR